MCIKSAVKRATKLCPASIELARAIELDDDYEMGRRQQLAVDIPIAGDVEQAQITGGTASIDAPAQQPVTQKVSGKAKEMMEKVGIRPAETPAAAAADQPPAEKKPAEGPGAGRPKACPSCKAKGREKANGLKSPVERETGKCDECRREETEALRDQQKTSVAAHDAEAGGETPVVAEPEPDPVDKLVQRLRYAFMFESRGNLPEAEISLSSLTGGKVQKFEKLADYLRANEEFIGVVTGALGK